eukprot:517493-Prorocentrum_minimum.AAC.1
MLGFPGSMLGFPGSMPGMAVARGEGAGAGRDAARAEAGALVGDDKNGPPARALFFVPGGVAISP